MKKKLFAFLNINIKIYNYFYEGNKEFDIDTLLEEEEKIINSLDNKDFPLFYAIISRDEILETLMSFSATKDLDKARVIYHRMIDKLNDYNFFIESQMNSFVTLNEAKNLKNIYYFDNALKKHDNLISFRNTLYKKYNEIATSPGEPYFQTAVSKTDEEYIKGSLDDKYFYYYAMLETIPILAKTMSFEDSYFYKDIEAYFKVLKEMLTEKEQALVLVSAKRLKEQLLPEFKDKEIELDRLFAKLDYHQDDNATLVFENAYPMTFGYNDLLSYQDITETLMETSYKIMNILNRIILSKHKGESKQKRYDLYKELFYLNTGQSSIISTLDNPIIYSKFLDIFYGPVPGELELLCQEEKALSKASILARVKNMINRYEVNKGINFIDVQMGSQLFKIETALDTSLIAQILDDIKESCMQEENREDRVSKYFHEVGKIPKTTPVYIDSNLCELRDDHVIDIGRGLVKKIEADNRISVLKYKLLFLFGIEYEEVLTDFEYLPREEIKIRELLYETKDKVRLDYLKKSLEQLTSKYKAGNNEDWLYKLLLDYYHDVIDTDKKESIKVINYV